MSADEIAVRDALAAHSRAIGESDAVHAVSALADDVAVYDLAPPLAQDPKVARDPAALGEWFDTWTGGVDIADAGLHVEVDGDLAAAWGLRHMTGNKTEGSAQSLWYRFTAVLRRIDGAWRIAHIHESVPFAMDGSGKALLDLKP